MTATDVEANRLARRRVRPALVIRTGDTDHRFTVQVPYTKLGDEADAWSAEFASRR